MPDDPFSGSRSLIGRDSYPRRPAAAVNPKAPLDARKVATGPAGRKGRHSDGRHWIRGVSLAPLIPRIY